MRFKLYNNLLIANCSLYLVLYFVGHYSLIITIGLLSTNSLTKFGRPASVRCKKFPHKCSGSAPLYCVAFCARLPAADSAP